MPQEKRRKRKRKKQHRSPGLVDRLVKTIFDRKKELAQALVLIHGFDPSDTFEYTDQNLWRGGAGEQAKVEDLSLKKIQSVGEEGRSSHYNFVRNL